MNEKYLIKTLILTISAMGGAIALLGISFYYFKDILTHNIYFVLPLPPIGVAAYVFVFSYYRNYDGSLPGSFHTFFREVIYATCVASASFLLCTIFIFAFVFLAKKVG